MDSHRLGRGRLAGWALAALLVSLLGVGCSGSGGGGGGGGGGTPDVTINIVSAAATKGMMAFSPAAATAHVGNVVRMHNGDSITHDIQPVTMGGPSWGSISAGGNRDVTVTAAATYTYRCVIATHTMSGTIDVQP